MTYEEVKQIRQNTTLADVDNKELSKMIDEAVEKQIEKQVKYEEIYPYGKCNICCTCGQILKYAIRHCYSCGQKLKWGDDE